MTNTTNPTPEPDEALATRRALFDAYTQVEHVRADVLLGAWAGQWKAGLEDVDSVDSLAAAQDRAGRKALDALDRELAVVTRVRAQLAESLKINPVNAAVPSVLADVDSASWGSPGAKLTADLLPFAYDEHDRLCVLLIQRDPDDDTDPYAGMWATLGGGMDPGETFAQTAVREAREEGGIDVAVDQVRLVNVFDNPHRDQRGRVISVAYTVLLPGRTSEYMIKAGDDAVDYLWAPVDNGHVALPLAFDHHHVVAAAYQAITGGRVEPVALAVARQELARRGAQRTGMDVPPWFELTDAEQRRAAIEAENWLRAMDLIMAR